MRESGLRQRFPEVKAGALHVRVGHVQGEVSGGERGTGLHVRTTTLGGSASQLGGAEAETMGGRVVMGPMCIVTVFNT